MGDVKKKPDDRRPQTRRQRARSTRLGIIQAAVLEFADKGYYATTMAAIAARAGVAVQTVHFVFHTKGELLGAVVDHAVLGDGEPTPPDRAEWYLAVLAEPDSGVALRNFVTSSGPILSRASAMNEVARTAASTDADARDTFDRVERLRADVYQQVLIHVAANGRLQAGLDLESATDVLLTLVSPRTYLSLTEDRGWPAERAIEWMADAAGRLILA